jgi:hypothetical protein
MVMGQNNGDGVVADGFAYDDARINGGFGEGALGDKGNVVDLVFRVQAYYVK